MCSTSGTWKTRNQSMNNDDLPSPKRRRVGLLYDDRMCKHFDSEDHVENPDRIISIWKKLQSAGINQRCVVLNAKEAEDSHIALVHGKKHIDLIKSISSPRCNLTRNKTANRFDSIYFNEGSSEAACLAAGSVVEVVEKVANGEVDSGFAIVRPPGHHAEANKPHGFCLLNNVAIAASYVLNEREELGISKILIVDWDVHHGNGTQKMFWKDPRVLVFSVHRHENGTFYPGGNDGSYQKIGEGAGAGYNINVPWENDSCGDADYVAAWDHVLIPVAKEYDPDLIIVSAGFDAAINDPLGGCCVTPYGFSIMLSKLMDLAQGKIVMALEGGYNLESLANSSLACVETLLDEKPVVGSLRGHPLESTWRVILAVRKQLRKFWPMLGNAMPLTTGPATPVRPFDHDSTYTPQYFCDIFDGVSTDVLHNRMKSLFSGLGMAMGVQSEDTFNGNKELSEQVKELRSSVETLSLENKKLESSLETTKLENKKLESSLETTKGNLSSTLSALSKVKNDKAAAENELKEVKSLVIPNMEAFLNRFLKSQALEDMVVKVFPWSSAIKVNRVILKLRGQLPEKYHDTLEEFYRPQAPSELNKLWLELIKDDQIQYPLLDYLRETSSPITPSVIAAIKDGEGDSWKEMLEGADKQEFLQSEEDDAASSVTKKSVYNLRKRTRLML